MKGSDRSGRPEANPDGEEPKERPKPKNVKSFDIDKRLLVGAWEKVRANNGAPGVDAVGIDGSKSGGGTTSTSCGTG